MPLPLPSESHQNPPTCTEFFNTHRTMSPTKQTPTCCSFISAAPVFSRKLCLTGHIPKATFVDSESCNFRFERLVRNPKLLGCPGRAGNFAPGLPEGGLYDFLFPIRIVLLTFRQDACPHHG